MPLTRSALCLNFAVPLWKSNMGRFAYLKTRGMRSRQHNSDLSASLSLSSANRLDKRTHGSRPNNEKPEVVNEVDVVKSDVGIHILQDDPSRLETMKVSELRTIMKQVGLPAKGRKKDLMSDLRHFLANINDVANVDETMIEPSTKMLQLKRTKNIDKDPATDPTSKRPQMKNKKKGLESAQNVSFEENFESHFNEEKAKIQESIKSRGLKRKILSTTQKDVSVSTSDRFGMSSVEPWMVLSHKKPQPGWIPYNPRAMRPPSLDKDSKFMKLISWNVNGLRALLKMEGSSALELAQKEDFDVLCLQETKLQEKDIENIKQCLIEGYDNSYWTCSSSRLGYSGTAIISRIKPLSVNYGLGILDHDCEGRLVTVEFDSFYLLSAYVPNSGEGLKRLSYRIEQWDPSLSNYMKELEKSKPVILTGDLNCAHQEIDIYNPTGNRRSAGFTDEERESFQRCFLTKGFLDTFRRQNPGVVGYTYWGYRHGGRATNKGWRLDYFLVSESLVDQVHDSYILPDVVGSDHCPIGLILTL